MYTEPSSRFKARDFTIRRHLRTLRGNGINRVASKSHVTRPVLFVICSVMIEREQKHDEHNDAPRLTLSDISHQLVASAASETKYCLTFFSPACARGSARILFAN